MILATELTPLDRPALKRHFLALDGADRRLRFGVPQRDSAIRAYVERARRLHAAGTGRGGNQDYGRMKPGKKLSWTVRK